MILTGDELLDRVAERTLENTRDIRTENRQRRNEVVDLYGVEYTRQGSGGFPATFYISISPDMVYLQRFEFKLIISPFVSSNGVGTNVAVPVIEPTSLTINSSDRIVPNPHTHEVTPHTHGLSAGIGETPTTASDFRVLIEGKDITANLMAQHGAWIDGEGIYPSLDVEKNYDILEVAGDFVAAGDKETADILTRSGYKRVQITSADPFSVTLVNYLKYSHLSR